MKQKGAPARSPLAAIIFTILFSSFTPLVGQELVFGIYPSNDISKVSQAFAPLTDYLAQYTGQAWRMAVTKDYDELVRRLAEGSVDIAWLGPSIYLTAVENIPDIQYLASYTEKQADGTTTPYYHALIVTTMESGIIDLAGLQGRNFGFVDRGSTSGFAYPLLILRDAGIDVGSFFLRTFFLKRHDKVVDSLLAGSLAGGAISDGTFALAQAKHGEKLRILAKSPPIPLDALVARAGLPQKLKNTITQALLTVRPDHPAIKAINQHLSWPAMGFATMPTGFYSSLKRVQDEVRRFEAESPAAP